MECSDFGQFARRVTVVTGRGASATQVVVYEQRRKGRKSSMMFKGAEKLVRRSMAAQAAYANRYLERHQASNAKHRDGWMRDSVYNVASAGKKAVKVMRKGLI
jgi:hypothetical protein